MTKTALDFGDEDDPKKFNEMVRRYYENTLNVLAQNYSVNVSQPTYTQAPGAFQNSTNTQNVTWTWTNITGS